MIIIIIKALTSYYIRDKVYTYQGDTKIILRNKETWQYETSRVE